MSSDEARLGPRRMHPAGIAVYAVGALRSVAFPLLAAAGALLAGGGVDDEDLARSVGFAVLAAVYAAVRGVVDWRTTTYWVTPEAVSRRRGLLSVTETDVPLSRVQGLDTVQGPLQRVFGVQAVHVQSAGGGARGEIVLEAVSGREVAELRAALASEPRALDPAELAELAQPAVALPGRRLERRELLLAALTAGQLGVIAPGLAALTQFLDELIPDEGGPGVFGSAPDSPVLYVAVVAFLLLLAWALSALGAVVAFGRFEVTRDGDRLLLRRGVLQRQERTLRVERVQAVSIVENLLRRPFGLAALRVEVAGYALEPGAAQTLFPLLRRAEIRPFLDALLPELADDPGDLAPVPPRAARRYALPGALLGLGAGGLAVALVPALAPWPLLLAPLLAFNGWLNYRAAGWRLAGGRLAVRSRALAWTTVLAPAGRLQSHALAQSPLQRRAALADLVLALGKGTSVKVRHVDAGVARELWERLRGRPPAP